MDSIYFVFALIPLGIICVPACYGLGLFILIIKRSGDRVLNMLTPLPTASVPLIPTVKVRRRTIDLTTKQAVEESIEATPEQVRRIFRKS